LGLISAFSFELNEIKQVSEKLLGVNCVVNDCECVFMLDSGASDNFLGASQCAAFDLLYASGSGQHV
jgi:hypothetical protein